MSNDTQGLSEEELAWLKRQLSDTAYWYEKPITSLRLLATISQRDATIAGLRGKVVTAAEIQDFLLGVNVEDDGSFGIANQFMHKFKGRLVGDE